MWVFLLFPLTYVLVIICYFASIHCQEAEVKTHCVDIKGNNQPLPFRAEYRTQPVWKAALPSQAIMNHQPLAGLEEVIVLAQAK